MSSKRDWPHVGVVSAFVLLLAVQNASNVQAGWCHSRFDSRSGNIARAASRPLLAFASPPQASPTHFVVLVHGYAGSPRDLTYLQRSIERIGSGRFRVHAAQCNSGRTRDGIRNGGSRLAKEVHVHTQHSSIDRLALPSKHFHKAYLGACCVTLAYNHGVAGNDMPMRSLCR